MNFVVLIVTILSLSKRFKLVKDVGKRQYYLSQTRITFMCSTLLGLSWLIAVLAVKDMSTVFQWLFCITTSLQGFFIFVFYILRNKDAMNEWRRCFVSNLDYIMYHSVSIFHVSSSKSLTSSELKPMTGEKNS